MKESTRDYELAEKIARLPDDTLVGSAEVAAMFGYSKLSLQTGSVVIPGRVRLNRKMQWRLGDVRAFIRAQSADAAQTSQKPTKSRGRPTKAEEIRSRSR